MNTLTRSFLIIFVASQIVACNSGDTPSSTPIKEVAVNNVSDKKIYLKELTTGESIKAKRFPKHSSHSNYVYFDYDIFGKSRGFSARLNEDGKINFYRLTLNSSEFTDFKSSMETKLTTENGKEVKFSCRTFKYNDTHEFNLIEIQGETCTIVSGKQKLTTKQHFPISQKPSSISADEWTSIYRNYSVELEEELDLSAETQNKKRQEEERKQEELIRRKTDI